MCMHEANLFIITIIFNDRITNNFSDIFVGEDVNDSCGTGLVYAPPLQKKENLTTDKTLTKPKKKSNIINQSLKKTPQLNNFKR